MVIEEITIGVNVFRIGKLDAMKQFHVARRLGPVITEAGPLIIAALKADSGTQLDIADPLKLFEPIANAFAKMKDEDAEYVLNTLLSVVDIQQKGGWAKVRTAQGIMMFDMELPEMFRLAGAVVRVNLANFTSLNVSKEIPPAA